MSLRKYEPLHEVIDVEQSITYNFTHIKFHFKIHFFPTVVSNIDLVFVVETSTKVTSKDLEGVKKLIQAFATHHTEKNTVRLGVMTFSKDIQIIRKLQVLNNDGSPVLKRTLTQLTSEPAIGDALEEAANHLIQHTS